ncbi:response regulator transcription factor [uncultured Amphritea sp.]|uniref:response regulator transcription factor n=1 Tax=uncultured Amphritea sp. TaxID=981605 RepID=UPI00262D8B57|nr:response regulator transcription factor [uncultured Amphritea sp.]
MQLKTILIIDPRPLLREGLKSVLRQRDYAIGFSDAGNECEFVKTARHCKTFDLIIVHESILLTANHGMITSYLYKTDNPIIVICDEVSEKLDIKLKFLNISGIIKNGEPVEEIVSRVFAFLTRRSQSERFSYQAYHETEKSKTAGDLVKQIPMTNTFFTKDKLEYLTDRQRDVLRYLKVGLMNKEIAFEMGIRESTVKRHVSDIFKKLRVQNRTQLAVSLSC